ncbi:hypothetical protein LTR53_007862 [Teratosphaeriaceae sp. CCFEE 6253]|nr:hypothetical protein LTR53_007862 [Teratosphaeriaceae sp. CCFEE 6253]
MAKRLRHASTSSVGSVSLSHAPKYASLEPEVQRPAMRCLLPPHKAQSFATYAEYEVHYAQAHSNRCAECHVNLPSAHFLDLHIAENHDPLLASEREGGKKTFACFVEDCDKICADWKKRRSHLLDKHGFPRNFDFFIVNAGIDGRRSMLRAGVDAQGHRRSSRERKDSDATTHIDEAEDESTSGDTESKISTAKSKATNVDDLAASMSSLKMVPRSVTFGRRKGGAGLAKS